jgi:hypothetical protein
MVNVWVTDRTGDVVTLNTGEVIDIGSFPGNGWTQNRCGNITNSVQENYLDEIIERDPLVADDPDKTMTEAELAVEYGGWFVELNTQGGSNEIRLRTTAFRLFPVDANNQEVTSGSGVSFNFTFSQVKF